MLPLFGKLYKEQVEKNILWTPSSLINRMGQEINSEDSIYYWAWKNDIPVFCPGITDGAIGDILFTNSFKNDLVVDVVQDIKAINKLAMKAEKSGVIILGGSLPKHHILNAHIWRNGADFGVFINTGMSEEGSDSGAKISEAYTWGKMRLNAKFAKIFSEASLIFPLLVAQTFAKRKEEASKLWLLSLKFHQIKQIQFPVLGYRNILSLLWVVQSSLFPLFFLSQIHKWCLNFWLFPFYVL